jgi:hypothetical protein
MARYSGKLSPDNDGGARSPLDGGEGGDAISMKNLLAVLLLISARVLSQSEACEGPGSADGSDTVPGTSLESLLVSPALDSLNRRLARIGIEKARESVASTDFWHRLIPRVSFEGGIGLRDLVFPDAGGLIVLPRDSYRITASISLSGLVDGSAHMRAELQVAEAEARFSLLVHRQSLARLALERKKNDLTIVLGGLREELRLKESASECQELLFIQGRVDFHAVAASRIELIRLRNAVARLALRLNESENADAGTPSP